MYDEYFYERKPAQVFLSIVERWHSNLLESAQSNIGPFSSVLEVGPGHGHFAAQCRKRRIAYRAIEPNPLLADELTRQGFEVVRARFPEGQVPPDNEAVWMSHMLEHAVTYDSAHAIVTRAYEILRPGGHLVVISPDLLSWGMKYFDADWTHQFPTSLRRVSQLFKTTGFTSVQGKYLRGGHTGIVRRLPYRLACNLFPLGALDQLISQATGSRCVDSWLQSYGLRQILVTGTKPIPVE